MADRSAAPEPAPDDAARDLDAPVDVPETEEAPAPSRSLFDRWWWQSASVAVIGIVVIGFQFEVISTGEAIPANWGMVVLGLGAVVLGAYLYWKDRPDAPKPDDR